jgi:hypothetical protein
MLTLEEFGELRHLWLKYNIELKRCCIYGERYGKRVPVALDLKRMRRYHKRILAVDRALKCLIARHPAEVFDAFICPTVCLHYSDALTRHDNA